MTRSHSRPCGRLLAAVLLLLAALGCSEAPAQPSVRSASDEDALLAWMEQRADDVGVVVRSARADVLAHNPDQGFPLASTIKVLTLLAYSEQVAAGRLDPRGLVATREVDELYLPRTDGGAHDRARQEWRGSDKVSLDRVARAMIRHSSNAAADFMLARVGGSPAVLATARRHGMPLQHAPVVAYDLFRQWSAESRDPRELARDFPAGTPQEWAGLLDRVMRGEGLAPAAAKLVQRHLSWPLEVGDNDERYDVFASKGGSLPGVLTSASYIAPRGSRR